RISFSASGSFCEAISDATNDDTSSSGFQSVRVRSWCLIWTDVGHEPVAPRSSGFRRGAAVNDLRLRNSGAVLPSRT
ncbi:unnamed protein product, partial [Mycena citricolor]